MNLVSSIVSVLALFFSATAILYSRRDHAVKTLEIEVDHWKRLYEEEKLLREKVEKSLSQVESENKALREILGPMLPDFPLNSGNTEKETKR